MDHLLLDQEGVPTFVEVKRTTDTRIRREVVGQMLDYAANALVYWPADSLKTRFESAHPEDADAVLEELMGPEQGADDFWQRVSDNLRAGHIRLVFVADVLPVELQRIIEFLNGQMNRTEVIGIEVRQFVSGAVRTLVPRVIGQTAQAEATKGASPRVSREWDRESFLSEFEARRGPEEAALAARIIDRANGVPYLQCDFGHGKHPNCYLNVVDGNCKWRAFSIVYDGKLWIGFDTLRNQQPFDDESLREEFRARLNAVPGFTLSDKPLIPSAPLAGLSADGTLDSLFSAIEWFSNAARASAAVAS